MIIRDVRWQVYRLPLRTSFATSHGSMAVREGAIVQITTSDGIYGIGEIAPLPSFRGEHLGNALALLPTLTEQLYGKTLDDALVFIEGVEPSTATCGLETALLDALGKTKKCSISELLCDDKDKSRSGVEVNAVIGASPTIEKGDETRRGGGSEREGRGPLWSPAMGNTRISHGAYTGKGKRATTRVPSPLDPSPAPTDSEPTISSHTENLSLKAIDQAVISAQKAVASGFNCIKLKVGNSDTLDHVSAIRMAIGNEMHLRLDANEAWTLEQAIDILTALQPFNIQYIEQPLHREKLDDMRTLRQFVSIPIAADEAVYDLESARHVLDAEAADILIIKPQLAGGLRMSKKIIEEASKRNVQCVITSTIESGIGVASALQLVAACPEVKMECGLATLDMLEDDLIVDKLTIRDGVMRVPDSFGLGVELEREALMRYCIFGAKV